MDHLPILMERSQTRSLSPTPTPDLTRLVGTSSWLPSVSRPTLNKRRLSPPAWLDLSKRTRVASPAPFYCDDHSKWTGDRQAPSSKPLAQRRCDGGEDGDSDCKWLCCICEVKHDTTNVCPLSADGANGCSGPDNTQLTPKPVQHRFFLRIEDDVFPMLASPDPSKPLTPSQKTLIECAFENATFIASDTPAPAATSTSLPDLSQRTAESHPSRPFQPDPFALGAPSPGADLPAIRGIRCISARSRSLEPLLASALDDMPPRTEAFPVRMPVEGYPARPKRTTRKRKPARAAGPTSRRPTKPSGPPTTFNHADPEWQGVPLNVPADLAFGATHPSLWYEPAPTRVTFDCSSFFPYPPGFSPYTISHHDSISDPQPSVLQFDRRASMPAYYPQATATWGFNHGPAPVDPKTGGLNFDTAYALPIKFAPQDVWPRTAMP